MRAQILYTKLLHISSCRYSRFHILRKQHVKSISKLPAPAWNVLEGSPPKARASFGGKAVKVTEIRLGEEPNPNPKP
jgi:hypothetical protein